MRLRLPVAVAASVALATAPLVAYADPGQQPVVTVSTVAGDPGLLVADITSDSAIQSAHAVVRLPGGGDVVWEHDLTQDGATDLWTSPRLPLNGFHVYDVAVTATDADGDSNAEPGPLALHYFKQPVVIEHSSSPDVLDVDHPRLEATGRVGL